MQVFICRSRHDDAIVQTLAGRRTALPDPLPEPPLSRSDISLDIFLASRRRPNQPDSFAPQSNRR
jgi:hypothetical protein